MRGQSPWNDVILTHAKQNHELNIGKRKESDLYVENHFQVFSVISMAFL